MKLLETKEISNNKWRIPESLHSWIFYIILILGIISIVIVRSIALAEDRENIESMQYYQNAKAYFEAGKYEEALECYEHMLPGYSESYLAKNLKGNIYLGMKEYQSAKDAYIEARKANIYLIENQGYVNNYANALLNLGEYAEAQQYFLKSIKLNTKKEITVLSKKGLRHIAKLTGGSENE